MKKFFVLAAGAALSLSLFVGSDKASAAESEFSDLDLKIESLIIFKLPMELINRLYTYSLKFKNTLKGNTSNESKFYFY